MPPPRIENIDYAMKDLPNYQIIYAVYSYFPNKESGHY